MIPQHLSAAARLCFGQNVENVCHNEIKKSVGKVVKKEDPLAHCIIASWEGQNRHLNVCPTCRRQMSATAGTIFEGTRELRHWFLGA